ncbi:unnamed protein product [Musa textilis]
MSSFSQSFPSVMSKGYSQADSDEIEVFEATWYFSGGIDGAGLGLQRAMREERVISCGGDGSLDTLATSTRPPQQSQKVENQRNDKKSRQPSSAGRRLAGFLNSFIKQAIYRKKSRALNPTEPEDASFEKMHAGRRKGSINHSQRMKSNDYSILCSTESCCNSKSSGHQKYAPFRSQRELRYDKRVIDEDWLAGRANSMDGYPENKWLTSEAGNRLLDKEALWSEEFMKKQQKWFRRAEQEDGAGSESSSELFELKNYDPGHAAFR